jgi:hypothetical protein
LHPKIMGTRAESTARRIAASVAVNLSPAPYTSRLGSRLKRVGYTAHP